MAATPLPTTELGEKHGGGGRNMAAAAGSIRATATTGRQEFDELCRGRAFPPSPSPLPWPGSTLALNLAGGMAVQTASVDGRMEEKGMGMLVTSDEPFQINVSTEA